MVILVEETGWRGVVFTVEGASSGAAETFETTDETVERSTKSAS